MSKKIVATVSFLLFLACSESGPIVINYGQDNCSYCKMTIVDKSFAAELISEKGKVFKFDAIECMAAFQFSSTVNLGSKQTRWVTDHSSPGELIDINSASFTYSESIRSPMGVGIIASSLENENKNVIDFPEGRAVDWNEITEIVNAKWMKEDSL